MPIVPISLWLSFPTCHLSRSLTNQLDDIALFSEEHSSVSLVGGENRLNWQGPTSLRPDTSHTSLLKINLWTWNSYWFAHYHVGRFRILDRRQTFLARKFNIVVSGSFFLATATAKNVSLVTYSSAKEIWNRLIKFGCEKFSLADMFIVFLTGCDGNEAVVSSCHVDVGRV